MPTASVPPQHHLAAEVQHQTGDDGDAHHHDGLLEHDGQHGLQARVGEGVVGLLELLLLVVLPDKSLDHPDTDEVFLHLFVQLVDLLLHQLEQGVALGHQDGDGHADHRDGRHQNRGPSFHCMVNSTTRDTTI